MLPNLLEFGPMLAQNGCKMTIMKGAILLASAVALVFAVAAQTTPYIAVGEKAPAFEGKAADGKDYSLAALAKDKPVFVVFWKERCPHNRNASTLFNNINKAYEGKAQMIGFVNASPENTKAWTERFGVNYPLLPDAEKSVIRSYQLRYSICAFEIGKDGKIAKVFPGYGAEAMNALNAAMAKAAGVDVAKPDLSLAPANLTWG